MDLNICTLAILRYHILVLILHIHKGYFHGDWRGSVLHSLEMQGLWCGCIVIVFLSFGCIFLRNPFSLSQKQSLQHVFKKEGV
jgi:hypothetical protein